MLVSLDFICICRDFGIYPRHVCVAEKTGFFKNFGVLAVRHDRYLDYPEGLVCSYQLFVEHMLIWL